jgi:hypothetical protein
LIASMAPPGLTTPSRIISAAPMSAAAGLSIFTFGNLRIEMMAYVTRNMARATRSVPIRIWKSQAEI